MRAAAAREPHDSVDIDARISSETIAGSPRRTRRPPSRGVFAQLFLTSLVHCACAHYPVHPELLRHTRESDG